MHVHDAYFVVHAGTCLVAENVALLARGANNAPQMQILVTTSQRGREGKEKGRVKREKTPDPPVLPLK